ncbi:hypothetical protein AAG906_035636 [Vitis piasezkii]
MEGDIFCYIHESDEVVKSIDGSIQYKGGWTKSIVVSGNIAHVELVSKVCGELNIDPNSIKLEFTVRFDPLCLLPLHDEATIVKMFRFNDMFCRVYVSPCIEVGEGGLTPIVASNSTQVISSHADPPMEIYTHSPTIESFGFSQRCAESNVVQLESRRFENAIMGSGQTFPNASEFRDAVYLMSLAYRFRYSFNRNNTKHMILVCTVDQCPWKVTAHAIGDSKIV